MIKADFIQRGRNIDTDLSRIYEALVNITSEYIDLGGAAAFVAGDFTGSDIDLTKFTNMMNTFTTVKNAFTAGDRTNLYTGALRK